MVTSDADAHERLLALTHDLRTPLTLVTGLAEMLRDDGLSDEQRADCDLEQESVHGHTLRVRSSAIESGGYHSEAAPRPSRWTCMSSR